MPVVSFLMSNYKTPPAYLCRALDSMLAQTFTDFEAVVINDGVKDESYDLLREYAAKDDRIRLIENEKNMGLAASLNRGIGHCRGAYIARMDTDDICLPERLALQTAYMDSHPDVMFAGAWAEVFEENENDITETWRPVMCPHEEHRIRLLFSGEPLLIHPTVIFRSDFLRKNKLRYSEDPQFRYTEDYEMWTRCADCGRAGILEQVVLKYRNAQSDSRITLRHAAAMDQCVQNTQKKLFVRLGISDAEYDGNINVRMLAGRKPYDIRYKQWMDRILAQNAKKKVYDQKILKRLFYERWYNIVYYEIAYESHLRKRVSYLLSLYPNCYFRFVKDFSKRFIKKHGKKHS